MSEILSYGTHNLSENQLIWLDTVYVSLTILTVKVIACGCSMGVSLEKLMLVHLRLSQDNLLE